MNQRQIEAHRGQGHFYVRRSACLAFTLGLEAALN